MARQNVRCRAMILLGLLRLIALCGTAPLNVEESVNTRSSTTALPSLGRSPDQEVGSPSELAWQAWLLVDTRNDGQSSLEYANSLRRLTPKSVFIAPSLPACAQDYQADHMGRCVKIVNVDPKAHIDFLLQRLNAIYANSDASGGSNDKPEYLPATGPLQLNIPLPGEGPLESSMVKPEEEKPEDSMEVPVVVSPQGLKMKADNNDDKEASVTVYEIKNDTKGERHESEETFFREDSTNNHDGPSASEDVVVPVVEIIEDSKESYSDVVDYKYSAVSTKSPSLNQLNVEPKDQESFKTSNSSSESSEVPSTLVLLLSSSEVPSTTSTTPNVEDLEVAPNGTDDLSLVEPENVTGNATGKEIMLVGVPHSTIPPAEVSLKLTDLMSQDGNFSEPDSYPEEYSPEIHTIDEQPNLDEASPVIPSLEDSGQFGLPNSSDYDEFSSSLYFKKKNEDFVRFPDFELTRNRHPELLSAPTNYVRFPSEEANSIHTQNYKDRLTFRDESYSSTSTKSSVSIHQKPSYRWTPSAWKVNRQQAYRQYQPASNQRYKYRPMLFRFWTRVPLAKNSNPYSTFASNQDPPNGPMMDQYGIQVSQPSPSHRMNFYKEMNLQDANGAFTPKFRMPVGG